MVALSGGAGAAVAGRRRSVIARPTQGTAPFRDFIFRVAAAADEAPPWSVSPQARDRYLREFLPRESLIVGPFYSTVAKYAAFGWRVTGPPRMAKIVHRMLHGVEMGDGWSIFILKVLQDLFGQDNGAFIEIIRTDDDPRAPVLTLNHLDAGRCQRTGIPGEPVWYTDMRGEQHVMKDYQIICMSEFPSPREDAYGVQICALSRILRAAQLARDISQYKREKISGKHVGAIHLVGGVSSKSVKDAMKSHLEQTIREGYQAYYEPLVIASLDPNATVSKATLEMASLPDGFNEEIEFRNYMITFANCFGTDLQDYMPLPGGNLGTAQQSEILHMKSQGKGPRLFMYIMGQKMNYNGVIPLSVKFGYGEQDMAEQAAIAELRKSRADTLRVLAGREEVIIDAVMARQIMNDDGDLHDDYLAILGERNELEFITLSSSDVPL